MNDLLQLSYLKAGNVKALKMNLNDEPIVIPADRSNIEYYRNALI